MYGYVSLKTSLSLVVDSSIGVHIIVAHIYSEFLVCKSDRSKKLW